MEAWKRVKTNSGAGGIDNITIADVEAYGLEKFIQEMQDRYDSGKAKPNLAWLD